MKKIIQLCVIMAAIFIIRPALAQITVPAAFTGAKPRLKHYNALYIINSADEKKIRSTLRNLDNALEDPRLKGKLHVELIAFGDGVATYQKSGPFEQALKDLQAKGVVLAQCSNTIKERNLDRSSLLDFISYVPSGNGEIILRQYEGWATVHP
jgi:intracellular sulfur oxidation DsrE/DsrF family protein